MLNRLFASVDKPWVPGRDNKDRIELDFSGSKLAISLPPNSVWDMSEDSRGTSFNIFDDSQYMGQRKLLPHEQGRFRYLPAFKRTFALWGKPWRKSELGTVSCIIGVSRTIGMPDTMSCFNPQHFEQALNRYLYSMYGPGSLAITGQTKRLAPINWKMAAIGGLNWNYFEVHGDFRGYIDPPTKDETASFYVYLALPIDHSHFLTVMFDLMNYSSTDDISESMQGLAQEIAETITLEYSDSATMQIEQAKLQWPEAHHSDQRQSEEWLYHRMREGNTELNEPNLVIIEHGSPPPEWRP